MNTQPEALRLADFMIDCIEGPLFHVPHYEVREAAAELRRLHEENENLKKYTNRGGHMTIALNEIERLNEVNQMLVGAVEVALEALKDEKDFRPNEKCNKAIQALRQALARAKE